MTSNLRYIGIFNIGYHPMGHISSEITKYKKKSSLSKKFTLKFDFLLYIR